MIGTTVRKARLLLALPLIILVIAGCPLPSDSSSSAKAITAFGFLAQSAVGVISEVNGTIGVTVPYGTSLTALVVAFATTGASVKVGSVVQVNDTTPNDFTNPVRYVVAAADASTKSYVVTVTVQAPSHDASLSNAVLVDSLSTTYTFVPAFSPTTYSYTGVSPATPSGGNPTFTLTLTTTNLNATITSVTEGATVDSHIGSTYTLTLASYENTVTILVTAQDGTTTQTYTMAIQARWRG